MSDSLSNENIKKLSDLINIVNQLSKKNLLNESEEKLAVEHILNNNKHLITILQMNDDELISKYLKILLK